PGDQKTCTVTFDDERAQLTVVEQVDNANGGQASPSDFSLAVKGGSPDPARFSGDGKGTGVSLDAGDYAVSQETAYGYSTSLSSACQGTIAPGEQRTCTVTNVHLAPLTLELSADSAKVAAGSKTGYTATLTNPNATPANVSYVTVDLPLGFTYQRGSTTGAVTGDPSIQKSEGLLLSWQGPGQIPASGSKKCHFDVRVPAALGDYFASASAGVDAPDTISSTSNPEIAVVKGAPGPPSTGGTSPPSSGPPPSNPPTVTAQSPAVAPPVFQQEADATPVSGDVLVRLAGTSDFVPLTSPEQVGYGTEFDVTNGRGTLTTVDSGGTAYHA